MKIFYKSILLLFISFLCSCSTQHSSSYFSSRVDVEELQMPPNLSMPENTDNYKMVSNPKIINNYKIDKLENMKIVQKGSALYLQILNKHVDDLFPTMTSFLIQMGLSIKVQDKSIGLIQTNWAKLNNTVDETGIRYFFDWVGWGNMYSLDSQYSFRINLWQNENDVIIFVTDYQMNEVYPNCKIDTNQKVALSDYQNTKWMPIPPNPQIELDFLIHYMKFLGFNDKEIAINKKEMATIEQENNRIKIENNILLINSTFDNSWYQVALALERVGLGINDKNREKGEFYVYQLLSNVENPDPGAFIRWFKKDKNQLKQPEAKYIVKLVSIGDKTQITIIPINKEKSSKDTNDAITKYLQLLKKELE